MSSMLLIANPVAARTSPRILRRVRERLEAGGLTVETVLTTASGDARRLAEEAVARGVEGVAVFGGDGTTMRVAAALVGTGIPLGLIPGGTGNLLAGNLRIPRSPVAAAEVILAGHRRRVDLGRVARADGLHYFAVAGGAGLDARVMGGTSAEAKRRFGSAAYWATTFRMLPAFRTWPFRLGLDGTPVETEATLVLVINCSEAFPPHLPMGPSIALDDGWLNVTIVRVNGLGQALRVLWHLAWKHRGPGPGRLLEFHRVREVTIAALPEQGVQLDGDPCGVTPVTATVVPAAIDVFAPDPASSTRRS